MKNERYSLNGGEAGASLSEMFAAMEAVEVREAIAREREVLKAHGESLCVYCFFDGAPCNCR